MTKSGYQDFAEHKYHGEVRIPFGPFKGTWEVDRWTVKTRAFKHLITKGHYSIHLGRIFWATWKVSE